MLRITGRLVLSDHHAVKLMIDDDGNLRIHVQQEAIDDGAVIVGKRLADVDMMTEYIQ